MYCIAPISTFSSVAPLLFCLLVTGAGTSLASEAEKQRPDQEAEADPNSDAAALELAGFRSVAVMLFTSDPVGSRVAVNGEDTCFTPCRVGKVPGKYQVTFTYQERRTVTKSVNVASAEQVQVHAIHGTQKPWKIVMPLYLVGAIFVAGGISSLVVHAGQIQPQPVGENEVPPDERVFHRNLGIFSLVVGVPLVTLASILLATGSPGEARVTNAPKSLSLGLTPTIGSNNAGLIFRGTF